VNLGIFYCFYIIIWRKVDKEILVEGAEAVVLQPVTDDIKAGVSVKIRTAD
jgi:hypothetical protein